MRIPRRCGRLASLLRVVVAWRTTLRVLDNGARSFSVVLAPKRAGGGATMVRRRGELFGRSTTLAATAASRDGSRQRDIVAPPPPEALGPPKPFRDSDVGSTLRAFRRTGADETRNFLVERVSRDPHLFVLRDFLSDDECERIRAAARASDMTAAETVTENDDRSRRNCDVAWIPSCSPGTTVTGDVVDPSTSELAFNMIASVGNLFLSEDVRRHPSVGVEDAQVLRYGVGGEFVLHHDGVPRVLTVIYYLNGVGGTWFPLATTTAAATEKKDDDSVAVVATTTPERSSDPRNKEQALERCRNAVPGVSGVLVQGGATAPRVSGGRETTDDPRRVARIQPGDALVCYNYRDDGRSAELNWRALHCGLPTSEEDGEKWIATHWFRVNDLSLERRD